jgi:ribosomal protein RSM22 (predicted rRNA methylase)
VLCSTPLRCIDRARCRGQQRYRPLATSYQPLATMFHLPSELQAAIEREVASFESAQLSRAARELSAEYQRGGPSGSVLRTATHRAAYLHARLPATYAATRAVFPVLSERLPDIEVSNLLDVGAGPGTAMWAALDALPAISQITLLERDLELINIGRSLAQSSRHAAARQAAWMHGDATLLPLPTHDVVVISYLLNELSPASGNKLVAAAWAAACKLLVIVEPGTPRSFQNVLAARQALIKLGAQVIAPCPHHHQCPMAAASDWCHFAVRVERTAAHRRLKGGSLGYEDEKFSYVVASRMPAAWPRARIVRHPLFRPGHVKLTLCTAEGLREETIGKSQKECYREARGACWGGEWGNL